VRETAAPSQHFRPDGHFGESVPEMAGPETIPDIIDFSGIVCFSMSSDGAPLCLNYRESPDCPRAIWWDDVYWRIIAPDFETFLDLFDLNGYA
jgi:hypothetical protein